MINTIPIRYRAAALAMALAIAASLAACRIKQDVSSTNSEVIGTMSSEQNATNNGSMKSSRNGTGGSQANNNSSKAACSSVENSLSGMTTTKPTVPVNKEQLKADIAFYQEIVDNEVEWLASLQLENGAMPTTYADNGTLTINPYFADFAVLAILDGGKKYHANVKKYMDWHFSHLNTAKTDYNSVDGTIYDYKVNISGGKITEESVAINSNNEKSYDSTDSYAANFLMVLSKYYIKSGDSGYIIKHYSEIKRIISAMNATMNNGLTLSKPDYKVKYLMDNCEVYEGIGAAVNLYEKVLVSKFSDASAMLSKLKADKKKVGDAIENQMWNISGGYYETALFANGDVAYNFTWNSFYPCATSQLFLIINGVVGPDSARAKLLYSNFNKYYSTGQPQHTWEKISIPDSFYWGSIAHAGAIMGDETRVKSYMMLYRRIMKKHAYPLFNADAGKATAAAAEMVRQLSARLTK